MTPTTEKRTRKIFVGGLPHSINEQDFRLYFEQFGTIDSISIMCDKNTGRARGFGFVIFTDEDSVEAIIDNFEHHRIHGKWVVVLIIVND